MSIKNIIVLSLFLIGSINITAQEDGYGKNEANTKFVRNKDVPIGTEQEYDYLNLENHPARSGVPLGGIGVGNIQFAPNGRFTRIGMNNIHMPIRESTASFFSFWYDNKKGKGAVRLVNDEKNQYGMGGVDKIFYKGLFPTVTMNFEKESTPGIKLEIHAYSSLVPHDVKNSSLPIVYFDVQLSAQEEGDYAVAFSLDDFIGRGIKDPESTKGMDAQIDMSLSNGEVWPELNNVNTLAENYSVSKLKGIRQFTTKPLEHKRATHQNYVNEVGVFIEDSKDIKISTTPSFNMDLTNDAWSTYIENGEFPSDSHTVNPLTVPGQQNGGSIIAGKVHLKQGESKTIRFVLGWSMPEYDIDTKTASRESYWSGGGDYNKYYHNFFSNFEELVKYGYDHRESNLKRTFEWQEPILNSTLPDWYKFKLINSGYVIYTNMILNKKGDVSVNEGAMGGLAGTMDQRISSHPFYQKLFTQLDRSEMEIFGDGTQNDGRIAHFIGNYYFGIGTVGGQNPIEGSWMIDNTGGWVIQLAKDYEQTGDLEYLKKWAPRVYKGMDFLKTLKPESVEIPVGPTTYDDFQHPPIYSYGASIYLATLKAASKIAEAIGDSEELAAGFFSGPISNGTVANSSSNLNRAHEFSQQFERTQRDMIKMLWNGRFFSYGSQIDGSGELDNILFTGQLAGQFVSRYCGWGDVIPMEMTKASLVSQFKISLSQTPDYYADKVWDIDKGAGIDNAGSRCWPFYLESYTGYTAFQAGYYKDAMELMKHIQLVHLRKGLSWSQNLWNPGEITYMTAPVTWFSTDVLAGAGINVPKNELRLAPLIDYNSRLVTLPLYYPRFWAELSIDTKKRKLALTVTKTFGEENITFSKIVSETPGAKTSNKTEINIPSFEVIEGNTLDLSAYYKKIVTVATQESILENPDKYNFIKVDAENVPSN